MNLRVDALRAENAHHASSAEAAEAVAAWLWQQAFSTALEPGILSPEPLGGGSATKLYHSLFVEEVASRAAARGAGIRQALQRQLPPDGTS